MGEDCLHMGTQFEPSNRVKCSGSGSETGLAYTISWWSQKLDQSAPLGTQCRCGAVGPDLGNIGWKEVFLCLLGQRLNTSLCRKPVPSRNGFCFNSVSLYNCWWCFIRDMACGEPEDEFILRYICLKKWNDWYTWMSPKKICKICLYCLNFIIKWMANFYTTAPCQHIIATFTFQLLVCFVLFFL